MKKKSTLKRLSLCKETLMSLDDKSSLEQVGGGISKPCPSYTCTTACSLCTP